MLEYIFRFKYGFYYSLFSGFVAKRNPDTGAPFIQELCQVINKKSKISHLQDMINEVMNDLIILC